MAELLLGNIKPAGADNIVVDSRYVKGGYVVASYKKELFPTTEAEIKASLKGTNGENIVEGSLCYCQEDDKFYQYNGTGWVAALEAKPIVAITTDEIETLWADTPAEPENTPAE